MFHTVLVPTDGSELAGKAVTAAIQFAKANQGKVIGLSVAEPYPFSPLGETAFIPDAGSYETGMREIADHNVRKIAAEAEAAQVPVEVVTALNFDPADEIVKAAEEKGCDIIFIASHGRSGFRNILLGSVTQKVLARSKLPVLVFR